MRFRRSFVLSTLCAILCACAAAPPQTGRVLTLQGATSAHDPVVIKAGARYYRFVTGPGIPIGCSDDLIKWRECGRVFKTLPISAYKSVPAVQELWAPDISFVDGRYRLYFSASTFGSNHSAIALATNATLDDTSPDYKWVDEGVVVESRSNSDFNAIDPNYFEDADGRAWLVFGSYWTGIKLLELDKNTGKPLPDARRIALAARRGGTAVEAPFLLRRAGYYYLFVSWDQCCQGARSTYHMRVGRSQAVTGPYVDRDGIAMTSGGGTLLLSGASSEVWTGPGHNAILTEGDTHWLVYHAYTRKSGAPLMHIESLGWDADGWPVAPSAQ